MNFDSSASSADAQVEQSAILGGDQAGEALRVRILLRSQHQPDAAGQVFEGQDPVDVFRQVLQADVSSLEHPILRILDGDISLLDLDVHHLTGKPGDAELAAWVSAITPGPTFWWRTHGEGLRLVFCGSQHNRCALAAAFSVPRLFHVEIKRDSRHPGGAHPKYPGARCGPVQDMGTTCDAPPDWLQAGPLDDRRIDEMLAERGMRRGGRYDHSLCPIDGDAASDAGVCVVVLDGGIYCHRCAGKGQTYNGCPKPGLVPYRSMAEGVLGESTIATLAKNLVHWAHAEVHLRLTYPHLGSNLLRSAFNEALRSLHGENDPRIGMIFNPDLRVVQGENAWFDSRTQTEVRVTDSTLTLLPGMHRLFEEPDKEGNKVVKCRLRSPLLDEAKSGIPLDGYRPVRFVRGIALHEDESALQVTVPPRSGDPIRLLSGDELVPEDQAFAELVQSFPGLNPAYLKACLAAAICADRGGRPPIIVAVGPTGSGKGEILRLGASFLADERLTLALNGDEEKVWRRIGSAVEAGRRFLAFDEFLRRSKALPELISVLLQLSAQITWRRYYRNCDIQTPTRAAFFLSAGAVPDGFKKSPEIRRRMSLCRLPRQVSEWRKTSGGDTADWRGRSKRNARLANSILTHAFNLCAAHDFNFDCVAEALGLCRIDEGGAEAQRDVLRDLYRHCRNEDGKRVLQTAGRYGSGCWIDALSAPCQEILEQLIPDEDTDERNGDAGLIFQLQLNLQMQPWNAVLDIPAPDIRCEMRRHRTKVVIRFVEAGKPRGQARINEDLPPIPDESPADPDPGRGDSGPDAPPDSGPEGPPLCPFCPQGGQNGTPPDGPENAENGPSESRYARYARYARLSTTSGGKQSGEGKESEKGKGLCSKKRAERAERVFDPARGGVERAERRSERPEAGSVQWLGPDHGRAAASLLAAGFPGSLLVLDFETYFDSRFSLSKLTIPEYVLDPRFRVHGLAIRHPDGRTEFRTDGEAALADLRGQYGEHLEAVTVAAHHAHFDLYVLDKQFGLNPAYIADTLSMARHVFPHGKHALADLAERFGLPPKGAELKDLDGVREPSPTQLAELARYAIHDADLCYEIAIRLLPQISRPDVELKLIDHTVRLFTERDVGFVGHRCRVQRRGAGRRLRSGPRRRYGRSSAVGSGPGDEVPG